MSGQAAQATNKTVVIIGTLDTKSEQLQFLKERIASRGHRALIMDVSTGGASSLEVRYQTGPDRGIDGKGHRGDEEDTRQVRQH
jgi:uncharacterized protein (UPF0261 family)